MASQSIQQTETTAPKLSLRLKLIDDDQEDAPEWMKEIDSRGWTVVPKAIAREKALAYANKGYDWLESWNLGYNRQDPSTRNAANLPWHIRGGLYNMHGIAHEQFVWDLKSEPGIIDKFARIWGTDELMVSFDGVNLSIPEQEREKSDPVFTPWAHVDQSPLHSNLQCVQGIMNLLPNGPDDGGLMVLDGSNQYYAELWKHFDHKKGENGWNTKEFQFLDQEMCDWLIAQGCKWVKVCAEPGDLLLWDSRTVHYGAVPSSVNDRFAAYVCYKPASHVSEDTKQKRLEVFAAKDGTAHDPSILRTTERLPPEDHPCYAQAVSRPLQNPILSHRAKQLIGLVPY